MLLVRPEAGLPSRFLSLPSFSALKLMKWLILACFSFANLVGTLCHVMTIRQAQGRGQSRPPTCHQALCWRVVFSQTCLLLQLSM